MRDNKKLVIILGIAVVILIGLVLTIILGERGGANDSPSITPIIKEPDSFDGTPTVAPTPTKKPNIAWQDKPTVTPEQPNVTITEIPKPTDGAGSPTPTPTPVPGWHVITKATPTPVLGDPSLELDYDDYMTKTEDGKIHLDTDKYQEDVNNKNSEHSLSQ